MDNLGYWNNFLLPQTPSSLQYTWEEYIFFIAILPSPPFFFLRLFFHFCIELLKSSSTVPHWRSHLKEPLPRCYRIILCWQNTSRVSWWSFKNSFSSLFLCEATAYPQSFSLCQWLTHMLSASGHSSSLTSTNPFPTILRLHLCYSGFTFKWWLFFFMFHVVKYDAVCYTLNDLERSL